MDTFDKFKKKIIKDHYILWTILTITNFAWILNAFLEIKICKTNSGILAGKENIFYSTCIILGILNLFLYRFLLSPKMIAKKIDRNREPKEIVKNMPNKKHKERLLSMLIQFNTNELKQYEVLSYLFVPTIICLGINNLITFSGFLLVISYGSITIMFPMVLLSTLLCFYMFPNPNKYIGINPVSFNDFKQFK